MLIVLVSLIIMNTIMDCNSIFRKIDEIHEKFVKSKVLSGKKKPIKCNPYAAIKQNAIKFCIGSIH